MMDQNTEEMQMPEDEMPAPVILDAEPEAEGEPDDNDKVSKIVQQRLAKDRASRHKKIVEPLLTENQQLKAKLAELMPNNPEEQMVPISEVPKLHQQLQNMHQAEQQKKTLVGKIMQAGEQDPELKELAAKGNNIEPALDLISQYQDLPNIVAVTKQLLKDPVIHKIFMSSPNSFEAGKYLKELSDKMDGRTDSKAKEYKPVPQINGSAASDDLSEYTEKYKGKRK